ncbi:MAG: hypothetical protein COS89_04505 [Deltaproteobacteria bacterium CG07_land_8_20_14_0_80_38_7]|nr:MAG: hypothetical protein COS89_04505 [Deltaproteobacteria bacterium CG07_land_8_20_14_0_80_38_7]
MQVHYPIKIQTIRSKGQKPRLYLAIPMALAAAIDMDGGEKVEWKLVDKQKLYLLRHQATNKKSQRKNKK